jgi:hypothetical protein
MAYQTMYRIDASFTVPTTGSTVYSGSSGLSVVNGNNKWVSVVLPAAPADAYFNYDTKYAIQVDALGVITNVQSCP